MGRLGDDVVDDAQGRQVVEVLVPHLGGVQGHHDAPCRLDRGLLHIPLGHIHGEDPLRGDAADPDECGVHMEAGEGLHGDGSAQRAADPLVLPAEQRVADAGVLRHGHGGADRVGQHVHRVPLQMLGEHLDRGAGIEEHRLPLLHHLRAARGDHPLGLDVAGLPGVIGGLRSGFDRDRSAVGASQHSLLLQGGEVLAQRGLADAEGLHEVGQPDAAGASDQVGDLAAALFGEVRALSSHRSPGYRRRPAIAGRRAPHPPRGFVRDRCTSLAFVLRSF